VFPCFFSPAAKFLPLLITIGSLDCFLTFSQLLAELPRFCLFGSEVTGTVFGVLWTVFLTGFQISRSLRECCRALCSLVDSGRILSWRRLSKSWRWRWPPFFPLVAYFFSTFFGGFRTSGVPCQHRFPFSYPHVNFCVRCLPTQLGLTKLAPTDLQPCKFSFLRLTFEGRAVCSPTRCFVLYLFPPTREFVSGDHVLFTGHNRWCWFTSLVFFFARIR